MRVTGGRLGGRTLRAPKGDRTRPTTDRVRESLFQILGDLSGLAVLDLYAGTGALGIEALSRGAARATFVEVDRSALKALRQNLEALGLEASSRVLGSPVERALSSLRSSGPYDLVLADPPWADLDVLVRALPTLLATLNLPTSAQLIIEHSARDSVHLPTGAPLVLLDRRDWGDTAVSMFSPSKPGKG